MSPRPLLPVPETTGPAVLDVLLPALATALAGGPDHGPAVLPLPPDPAAAARVLAALRPDEPLERADVAAVVATSGSTGEPKGALLPAAALLHSARATLDRLGGPGRWLLALPSHHVAGLQVLTRSLVAGTEPEVLDLAGGFDVDAFATATARLVADGGGARRYTALVPTQLVRLLDAGADLTAYDAVLVGGAAVPEALLARAVAAGVPVVTTYGMSETCGGCVYDGRVLDGVEITLDDATGERGAGRIRVGGPTVFAGYRLRPNLTAAALVAGRHATSDLGRWEPDGRLAVLGRVDDVVVTGGANVALPLVAQAVASHPAVAEAAAVGRPDAQWGQRVVAVVVPREPAAPPSLADLRRHVTERAGAAAAPRELVLLDALPLLGPGKVDRAALAALPTGR